MSHPSDYFTPYLMQSQREDDHKQSFSLDFDFVAIPSGEFWMGSSLGEFGHNDSESPKHLVFISSFLMSRFPVTQSQWRKVAGLQKVSRTLDLNPSFFQDDEQQPVEKVTWHDAKEFCERLTRQYGRQYRLPSEAEWEYACRANTKTPYHFGESINPDLANYGVQIFNLSDPNSQVLKQPNPVGKFPANPFGLHDMHGNVWEWCLDSWHDNYEGAPDGGEPWENPLNLGYRLVRGGSWDDFAEDCRSASRVLLDSEKRYSYVGFRVVCENDLIHEVERKPKQLDKVPFEFDAPTKPLEREFITILRKHSLPLEDVLRAIEVFSTENSDFILTKVKATSVSLALFLKLAEMSKILSQTSHEAKSFSTGIVLVNNAVNKAKNFSDKLVCSPCKNLGSNFFDDKDLKKIVQEAIKVDGQKRVFMISSHEESSRKYETLVCRLDCKEGEEKNDLDFIGDPKWRNVSRLIENNGCAFILPGDGRVKLFVCSEQIAELTSGKWKISKFKETRRKIQEIAREVSLDETIALNIINKCLYASEHRKGITILIAHNYQLISDHCTKGGALSDELQSEPITKFTSEDYLNITAGDGAIILSKDGFTLATQVFLKTDESDKESLDGFGSRHRSASTITQSSDAIAIVVSQDGPITIFRAGKEQYKWLS
jgi:formylglycine-generating enzyme required for sulfatase activity/DNA integrity scanning protein DisA with diadenylate cyclase activity